MSLLSLNEPIPGAMGRLGHTLARQRVWLFSALIVLALLIFMPAQGVASIGFVRDALASTAPFLVLSIVLAAYAGATGADQLIARAFTGAPLVMVLTASLVGALSPFCSCGVIPLVAALLAMGVPLSAVMAFWLASPVMDPSMFALTTGVLDWNFAIAKTLAAVGLGLFGGLATYAIEKTGGLASPLREGVGNGGCAGAKVSDPKPVAWRFWEESARLQKFVQEAISTSLFLLKWLVFAFVLESLMVAYVPADLIAQTLGGQGIGTIALAALVGVPAYLNGYAALPLVAGLMEQGMSPGAGLAFLVAGGVSSLPAAIAVWALVRPPAFVLYLVFALTGSMAVGLLYQGLAA